MIDDKQPAERRLDNLLMTRDRHRMDLEAYREKGDASGVARCERELKIIYTRIREHCAEHDLELPDGVPSEGAE